MNIVELAEKYIKWAWSGDFFKRREIIPITDKIALIIYCDHNTKLYLLRDTDPTITIDFICMEFEENISSLGYYACSNYQVTRLNFGDKEKRDFRNFESQKIVFNNYRLYAKEIASELLFDSSPEVRSLAKMIMEE